MWHPFSLPDANTITYDGAQSHTNATSYANTTSDTDADSNSDCGTVAYGASVANSDRTRYYADSQHKPNQRPCYRGGE